MPHTRYRVPAVVTVLVAGGLLLAGCGHVGPSESERGSESFAAVSRVEVDAPSGTVEVRQGPEGSSRVDRVLRWRGDTKPELTQDVRGDVLYVEADCPGSGTCEADLVVTVPTASAVRADLDTGNVTVAGLTGEHDLSTGAGTVTGTDLGSAQVTARSRAGNVDLGFAAAPRLVDAESSAGNVTVRVPTGGGYDVEAESSAGNTRVEVPDTPGAENRIAARSSAGNVAVIAS